MTANRIDIGLDAGGSSTHLLGQASEGEAPFEHRGPGANPNRTSVEAAARVLVTLVREAIQSFEDVDCLSVCAGVSGAGREREQNGLSARLRRALGEAAGEVRVEVVHDAEIALDAAFGAGSGVVVIVGTGSVVCGRVEDGTTRRVGGWGHRLGDAGSGYAIGQAGLRAVAEALDGGRETALRASIRDDYGIDDREDLLGQVYREEVAFQDVAPIVVEVAASGDEVASGILSAQTAELAQQVDWLVRQADTVAPRITLLGGMLHNDRYAQRLRQSLLDRFPAWSIEPLQDEPVVGALRRARRLSA